MAITAPNNEIALRARDIKALTTTKIRATTLLADGYKVETTEAPGIYFVRRPAPLVDRRTGEQIDGYTVDICQRTCNCPAHANLGDCKHIIATLTAIAEALSLVAPMLANPLRVKIGGG
jgi:hypothetical protein